MVKEETTEVPNNEYNLIPVVAFTVDTFVVTPNVEVVPPVVRDMVFKDNPLEESFLHDCTKTIPAKAIAAALTIVVFLIKDEIFILVIFYLYYKDADF
jgi:hypothetical protein